MLEELQRQKSFNEQKKKTRRTRKDEQGRNFTCTCGKSYLSYPALYTHIKTKHQGKAPKQETNKNSKPEPEQQNQVKQPLSQAKQILQKFFPGINKEAYPTPLCREDQLYIDSIMKNWQLVKEAKLEDILGNYSETINNIFARFLCQLKNQVKQQAFLFLSQLFCYFHGVISELNKDSKYCSNNNGTLIPNYFNQIIVKNKVAEPKKGSPLNNSLILTKILFCFGLWMFQQRYTNLQIKFNSF